MSWWTRVVKVLKGEAAEAGDLARDVGADIEAELDRKEREMRATPEERLAMAIDDASAADAEFDEAARRIAERGEQSPPPA